jgi:DNA topoisomerase-3
MTLYIAEKPSLGRAIADALPGTQQRGDGFIRVGDATVSWCVGHLLEQAEPEAYDPVFKRWSHDHLPIVPACWQMQEKAKTKKQLGVLRKLVKEADQIVHAGDPDREGQLLVDQVIHHLGANPNEAQRLLVNDLNRAAVVSALLRLRANSEFKPLSTSALARSRADWLYGINLTRAYTLQGRKVNYGGVLSVGRVQTPLLGLVVRRDEEIDAFVSKPFYEVWANLETLPDADGDTFRARWIPSDGCARFLDSERRNLSKPLAQNVARRISDQPATVTKVDRKKRRERPPLPHSLSSLQIDAARLYRLSAQHVLDICQRLYEQHKLITYPRSDCRYLPAAHHGEARSVIDAIGRNPGVDRMREAIDNLDTSRRARAFDDASVGAHHAIIPTARSVSKLTADECDVYALIVRNYFAQFLPDHEYAETRAEIDISGGLFIAKATEEGKAGWRLLLGAPSRGRDAAARNRPDKASHDGAGRAAARSENAGGYPGQAKQSLPALHSGQQSKSLQADVQERHTTAPARFNDASLLLAMTNVAAFVADASLRAVLKDTDGLGTEATRAGIIELLFRRDFLVRHGKHIESTVPGRALIHALPEAATLPDMTARWEAILTAITERTASYDTLMQPLVEQVTRLVVESRGQLPTGLAGLGGTAGHKTRGAKRKPRPKKAGEGRPGGAASGRAPRRRKSGPAGKAEPSRTATTTRGAKSRPRVRTPKSEKPPE